MNRLLLFLLLSLAACQPRPAPPAQDAPPQKQQATPQVQAQQGFEAPLQLDGEFRSEQHFEGVKLIAPMDATVVAFTPDGKLLSAGGQDNSESLILWDPKTGERIGQLGGLDPEISAITVAKEANLVAAAGVHDHFGVWTLPTEDKPGALLDTFKLSKGLVYDLELSADGKEIAVGDGDGRLHLWNLEKKTSQLLFDDADSISTLAFSADAKLLAVGFQSKGALSLGNNQLALWDLEQKKERWRVETSALVGLAFDDESQALVSGESTGLHWRELTKGETTKSTLLDAGKLYGLALTRSGDAFACGNQGNLFTSNGEKRSAQDVAFWSLAISPDERVIAAAGRSRRIYLWNTESLQLQHTPTAHTNTITSMAFLKEDLLLSGDRDGEVIGWDLEEKKSTFQRSPKTTEQPVLRLAPHPDQDRFLLLRGQEDLTGYFDAAGVALPPFETPVTCEDVVISPDGKNFAAPTSWKPVPLHDAETGALQMVYGFPDEMARQNLMRATSVAFSPGSDQMATARWDEDIQITTINGVPITRDIEGILDVAWSPDGALLAGGLGELNKRTKAIKLQLIDASSGNLLMEIEDAPSAVRFTRDSLRVAGIWEGQLHLWSVEDGTRVATYGDEMKGVTSFALSPSGQRIALGYQDGSVELLKLQRDTQQKK